MSDYRAGAQRIVDLLGEPAALDLLRLLESDDKTRADAFRKLHERGGHEPLLDALTDLEADPLLRGWFAEYLRMELL